MQMFLTKWAGKALNGLLARESRTSTRSRCTCGGPANSEESQVFRCYDCHVSPLYCRDCILKSHERTPFHQVEHWDNQRGFWRRHPLTDLEVVLHLGHPGGQCEFAHTSARKMKVVSDNGIHSVGVRFCQCRDTVTGETTPEATQLLREGFWPASWEQPATAFTIQSLKTFSLLANQANVNAYDYFETLRRKTDGVAPHDVSVSCSGQTV